MIALEGEPMRYQVYHYVGQDRLQHFSASTYQTEWPGPSYRHVCDVEAMHLDEVFDLTQHLEAPWTDGPKVVLTEPDRATLAAARANDPMVNSSVVLSIRSTSVGDVVVTDTGIAYGVASFGFEGLGPVGNSIRSRIDRIRNAALANRITGPKAYELITALQDWSADRWAFIGRDVIYGRG